MLKMKNQQDLDDLLDVEKENLNMFSMILNNQYPTAAATSTKNASCPYVSMFRIDGVPILPPLLTTAKKIEMQKYKDLAIRIERKLKNNNVREQQDFAEENFIQNITTNSVGIAKMDELTALKLQTQKQLKKHYMQLANEIKKQDKAKNQENCEDTTKNIAPQNHLSKKDKDKTPQKSCVEKVNFSDAPNNDTSETSTKNLHNNQINLIESDISQHCLVNELNSFEQLKISDQIYREKLNSLAINRIVKPIPSIYVNPPTPQMKKIISNLTFCHDDSSFRNIAYVTDETHEDNMSTDEDFSNFSKISQNSIVKNYLKLSSNELETYNGQQIKRSSTSPSLNPINDVNLGKPAHSNAAENAQNLESLPRSNSFTLDFPSQALVQHLQKQNALTKHKKKSPMKSTVNRDTIESKAKRTQKAETKRNPYTCLWQIPSKSSNANSFNCKSMTNSMFAKSKRTKVFDTSLSTKKLLSPSKSMNSTMSTNSTHSTEKSAKISNSTYKAKSLTSAFNKAATENETKNSLKRSLEVINNNQLTKLKFEHRQRLNELIMQQQMEQKRIQKDFEKQQKMLLKQLTLEMEKAQQLTDACDNSSEKNDTISSINQNETLSTNATDTESTKSPSATIILSPANSIADLSSLRSLTTAETITTNSYAATPRLPINLTTTVAVAVAVSSEHETTSSSVTRPQLQPESERRLNAANIINAYARGYLVRRLFKTDQIQRIVETIKETMYFIIDLHVEEQQTANELIDTNKFESNTRLKARMLQQLSSACRTLHTVFFQTTAKERMDIIAHDRKRIISKLLSMNLVLSPRVIQSF